MTQLGLFFLLILPVIVIHEMGHYLAARWAGICVESFNIGLGPRLLGVRIAATEWNLRLLPLGGYVSFPTGANAENPEPGTFYSASVTRRLGVILAGCAANVASASLLFALLMAPGVGPISLSPALTPWEQVTQPLKVTGARVVREVHHTAAAFVPDAVQPQDASRPESEESTRERNWVRFAHHALHLGFWGVVLFWATVSIFVAVVNLVPIPFLDGGQAVWTLMEGVRGGPFPLRVKTLASTLWLLVAFALFVL